MSLIRISTIGFLGLLLELPLSLNAQQIGNIASTARFDLRSDPEVALHHFLIAWASADVGEWPPYALEIEERENWRSVLDEEEQRLWSAAIQAYDTVFRRSLVFDAGLIAVREWAAGVAGRAEIPVADRSLVDAIEAALPVYQRHWWSAHDQANRAWITAVAPTLGEMEDEITHRLAMAYGGRWPNERTPIDVVVYANAVGAYSTGGRLTISSTHLGNQMPQAVEMIFHEASHLDPLEQPLRTAIDNAYSAIGETAPDRLWHDFIFYTSGEVTRLVFASRGDPSYQHYGSFGVYRRGERWTRQLPAFESAWRPFLMSRSGQGEARRTALQAIAVQLQDEH